MTVGRGEFQKEWHHATKPLIIPIGGRRGVLYVEATYRPEDRPWSMSFQALLDGRGGYLICTYRDGIAEGHTRQLRRL